MFAFNANTRPWNGHLSLFVGLDGMVQLGGGETDLKLMFDHEAFHLYQQQVNPDVSVSTVWSRLWREGLATYVSRRLNPGASRAEVLMSPDLAQAPAEIVAAAARTALARLDGPDGESSQDLFDLGSAGPLRPRIGYVLGLAIAEMAGGSLDLDPLARLEAAQARRFVTAGLAELQAGA